MAEQRRRFDGKVALVTGAASGIGRAAALRFAAEGAQVALLDVDDDGLQQTLDAIKASGGEGLVLAADVSRSGETARCAAAAVDRFGGLDCCFNNAGVLGAVAPIADYPEETFDRVLAINVKGCWLGMRAVLPYLRARGGGAIVNTASIAGLRGTPRLSAYTASKHAVVGLTKSIAMECARDGIRVNAVCPGPIDTPMSSGMDLQFDGRDPDAFHRKMEATIPMRRYGTADEIAAVVAFLCSDDASFVTGAIYTADGGSMA